jgi:fructose-bisphosphate aldolase class II/tagatose 1,6-diphosphate aldolase GatY/KbaY
MNLTEKLLQLKKSNKAILAANFYNFETLSGILTAAHTADCPVILQLSESSIRYMGIGVASAMAKKALSEYKVEGWLHLDHGSSLEMVQKCLDHGFDSVMIDASEKPFEENVEITGKAVDLARKYNANVEAELGFVAKLGQDQLKGGFTQPDEASKFAVATGVNALAVSIGSAHGFYKQAPNLDIPLLSQISKSVAVPLVLHGSSGIPDVMLQDAIRNGICKVNLATETKNAFMHALQETLANNEEIDLRIVFPRATSAVTELILNKLNIIYKA